MKLPMTAMAPSTLAEQSISSYLHAEVMVDLDDGRHTFVAATESNLGDLRETSPARFLGMVADARAQLDRMERLANEFEAEDAALANTPGSVVREGQPINTKAPTTTADGELTDVGEKVIAAVVELIRAEAFKTPDPEAYRDEYMRRFRAGLIDLGRERLANLGRAGQ